LAEFTGERVIPGEVDINLFNEHLARYTFAARLVQGKSVLDAGCGTGYGSAELARTARSVVGVDSAPEAIEYARAHYRIPHLRFELASVTALPHEKGSFDLVVAFEVIEHLGRWNDFLLEARRVLAPDGLFIVSTPNKRYYTDSRGDQGANPFHVHEFEFQEFYEALKEVFPFVSLFLENHVEGVLFQPYRQGNTAEVRVDAQDPIPDESHFFVAICAHRPQPNSPAFVHIPRTGNILRERERHIALLQAELATKNAWLEKALREHQDLMEQFAALQEALEKSNQWAQSLNQEIARARKAIAALDQELEDRTAWARRLDAEVAELTRQTAEFSRQLALVRLSRWVKLGRKLGLGPDLPA
jgi:SAM-dependent methyltransferase